MGTWATASLCIISVLWMEGEAMTQFFQNYERPPEDFLREHTRVTRQQRYGPFFYPRGKPIGVAVQLHSASGLKPFTRLTPPNTPFGSLSGYERNDFLGNPYQIFNFDDSFQQDLNVYQKKLQRAPQTFPVQEANERHSDDGQTSNSITGYDDYRKSQATHILGPHQVETIQSEHYHKKVPAFDVSDFHHQHHAQEKHGEVHYHQHKHVHKHDHKQEHVHQHKNDHLHKHLHQQEHKHAHHSEHKHGHQHKHDHHQDHKHDHHHDHKHDHHQEHKHDHHHGHKHQHHSENKHEHKHGHTHDSKHNHDHKHKHQHSKHH